MKRLLLLAVVGFVVFYFLLISSSRPMGLPRLLVLLLSGLVGLLALCEILNNAIDGMRKTAAEARLNKRLQKRSYS